MLSKTLETLPPLPTISDLLRRWSDERPDTVALKFGANETSFTRLRLDANAISSALIAAGCRPGDRLAYLGKNSDLYFKLLYGAAQVGIAMVPISWKLTPTEIAHMIADSGACIIYCEPEYQQSVATASSLMLTTPVPINAATVQQWLIEADPASPESPAPIDSDLLQIYTSGTTGLPKGVVITQRNLVALRVAWPAAGIEWDAWAAGDIGLVSMPIAHIAGTNWGFMGLFHGCTIVITTQFDSSEVLGLIEHAGVNRMFIVAAALQAIVRDPRTATIDFSRMQYLYYGASPIALPLLRESMAALGVGFCQQYGLTEASGTVVALGPEDHHPEGTSRMLSTGRALPGVELKIVDEAGVTCAMGKTGEVLVRSASIMQGYWNNPLATAAAVDSDGWLHTGDAGYLDEDDYLYICDRIKDMIVSGGENVYPAEVESLFCAHPAVAEAAVIGVPDDRWGEAVKLFVVAREGHSIDPDEIIAWGRPQLASFKLPKTVEIVPALPRNASGKMLKRELRKPFWEGRERQVG